MSYQPGFRRDTPRLAGIADLWPISVDQYHQMIAAEVFPDTAALELIEGYLVGRDRGRGHGRSHRPRHAAAIRHLTRVVRMPLGNDWVVQSQLPVVLGATHCPGEGSELQPDLAVAVGRPQRYHDRPPGPGDLRLVVEVADSSLLFDRQVKGPLYAAAGIGVYWIVNLIDQLVEVFTDPDPATGQYRAQEVLAEDQQVELAWEGLAPVTFHVKDFTTVRPGD